MKNFLLILIFVLGASYYFVPYDIKVSLLEKVWIDSSILAVEEVVEIEKWEVVNLKFDDTTHKDIFKWDISNGEIISDLSWASLPYVKCFYQDSYNKFNWNTIHHRVLLWKNKTATVKLIQNNSEDKLSLYVYKTDSFSKVYPPEKNYVFDCISDSSSSIEKVINIKGNTVTSDIVIWVAWVEWKLNWSYSLEIEEK